MWAETMLARMGGSLFGRPLRTALGYAAGRYAAAGWDVIPGAYLRGRRFDCGRAACRTVGCHPAVDDWESVATHDRATVAAWWRGLPFTVLLATGRAFDVLEVPGALGRAGVAGIATRALGGPVAVGPDGRWMFLVRAGATLLPQLSERADVVLHGQRSWVPAPPTRQPDGPVRLRVDPGTVGFRVADSHLVQSLIAMAIPRPARPRPTRAATTPPGPASAPAWSAATPRPATPPATNPPATNPPATNPAVPAAPPTGGGTVPLRGGRPMWWDSSGPGNQPRSFGRAARRLANANGTATGTANANRAAGTGRAARPPAGDQKDQRRK